MRNVLLLIAVGAVAVSVYFLTSGQEVVETAPSATNDSATQDPGETGSEEATETTSEPTEPATEAVEEAVQSAVDAAEGAVEDAAEAAQEAVDDVVDQAADAVESAADAATDALEGDGVLSDFLTVDGFDLSKVVEMIDGSDLGAVQKATLKAGIEQAQDNPELLSQLLDQAREALGL